MNCNVPTDICFSFAGFQQRGGRTDHHSDGWGIAFFEGAGVRLLVDPEAAVQSPIAELVRNYPIHSLNVIAHIRRATKGRVALENTHPFMRELWGKYWIFAHNGTLEDFAPPADRNYRPVGDTDSEAAFCAILNTLRDAFPDRAPSIGQTIALLSEITAQFARHGTFNYLLSNGEHLFAHCSDKLCYIVRKAPFTRAHLVDEDVEVDFNHLTTPNDRVAVIATSPLTDNETWTALAPGELAVFHDGERLAIA